jgi:protein SCO1/2
VDFVTGLFGLVREPDNGYINHDLRTALIGPDGKLVHVWRSNVWTPYEVQRMVQETLQSPLASSAQAARR